MAKFHSILGIVAGIAIIIFSMVVFSYEVNLDTPDLESIKYEGVSSPDWEEDEYYGGDAYTGIQQAAAQAANNLIPVFDAVEAGNEAMEILNDNMAAQAEQDVDNLSEIISAVQLFFGFLLLSVGLLTVVKYLGKFLSANKEKAVPETVAV